MKLKNKVIYVSLIILTFFTSFVMFTDISYASSDKELFNDGTIRMYYEVTSSWNGGYNANIQIENISDKTIEQWKINFDLEDNIYNLWGQSGIKKIICIQ